jgi:hypothetical protein
VVRHVAPQSHIILIPLLLFLNVYGEEAPNINFSRSLIRLGHVHKIYHVQGEHDNCYTLAAVYKNNYKAKNNKLILKLLKTNYWLRRV